MSQRRNPPKCFFKGRSVLFAGLMCSLSSCRSNDSASEVVSSSETSFILSPDIHQKVSDSSGDGYVAVGVPFAPVQALYKQVGAHFHETLKNRGEAHITAITPPEYTILNQALDRKAIMSGLPLTDGNQFQVVCLGRGVVTASRKTMRSYFIVVNDMSLLQYRKSVFDRFVAAGGDRNKFDPAAFHPHITVGYTDRDLHIEDGVLKDKSSCIAGVKEQ